MNRRTTLTVLIKDPTALRGLDHLIEQVRRVLDRHMCMPTRKLESKTLARTA